LRTPLQVVFAFWSVPLIVEHLGEGLFGAYGFAWGFGFLQFLLELGMSSALQRQVSERWTRGDRAGVRRSVACGMAFYATTALVQAGVLLALAGWGIPASFRAEERRLIVQLLVLQAVTAPCFGLSVVVSSVLQAARRYDFIPRYEFWIVILRFVVLWAGLKGGVPFVGIVVAQTVISVGLSLGPALWVMVVELGLVPRFGRFEAGDVRDLMRISVYMALLQLSVVLADKLDTTVLGYALEEPAAAIAAYQAVSKPFLQIRQMGWMLAYLVMPAVASLAAAEDRGALERIKYDGTRLLVGVLLPVVLLAALDARPFLEAWVPRFADQAVWMRLFLLATAPLVLSVLVQMATGLGKVRVIALAALGGSLVNLPVSYIWTRVAGDVSGVIWGTVLTTWVSNLLIPGLYCFRELGVSGREFVRRALGSPLAGAALLLVVAWAARGLVEGPMEGSSRLERVVPLVVHLTLGVGAYVVGYGLRAEGRGDLIALARRVLRRMGVWGRLEGG
jgi:Na+-driven multidrug efflux pump